MGVAAKELSDKLSTIEIVFLEMFWSFFYTIFYIQKSFKTARWKILVTYF